MPSPFPGMDPYLENPLHWRGLHNRLITFAAESLKTILPPGFIADIDEQLYVVEPERPIYPDVAVLKRPAEGVKPGRATVLEPEDPPGMLTAYPIEINEPFIEILTGERWDRVVTIIEILSPANKASGSRGREEYLQKQGEVLNSATHLLEIDLLRRGAHTVSAPLEFLRERGRWDYLVSLHQSSDRYTYLYWMIGVRQRLPRVRVPLDDNSPAVVLDVQAVFERAYDSGLYAQRVDYREEPVVPLKSDDAAWANALLREAGLRD